MSPDRLTKPITLGSPVVDLIARIVFYAVALVIAISTISIAWQFNRVASV